MRVCAVCCCVPRVLVHSLCGSAHSWIQPNWARAVQHHRVRLQHLVSPATGLCKNQTNLALTLAFRFHSNNLALSPTLQRTAQPKGIPGMGPVGGCGGSAAPAKEMTKTARKNANRKKRREDAAAEAALQGDSWDSDAPAAATAAAAAGGGGGGGARPAAKMAGKSGKRGGSGGGGVGEIEQQMGVLGVAAAADAPSAAEVTAKSIKKLKKTLRQIVDLQAKVDGGVALSDEQRAKLGKREAVEAELAALEKSA